MKSSSGAPPSPARNIRATAARRPPSSLPPPTDLCASRADRSFTMSGCSKSVVMSSPTALPTLFTSSRRRVPYEEIHSLHNHLLQHRWNFIQRMLCIETVIRAFDETKRAYSNRQLVKALGIGAGHRLVGSPMYDEPRFFDLCRRGGDVELGISVNLHVVEKLGSHAHHLARARVRHFRITSLTPDKSLFRSPPGLAADRRPRHE